MKFRIAIIQYKIVHLDRDQNLERIEAFLQKAAHEHVQVVVFPEDCITGSIFGDLSRLDIGQTNRDAFRALASKYKIDVVTGSSMEKTDKGNFNTSYYIDAYGEILGTYRKNHLYPSERSFLNPGTEVPVFQTAYGKAGIVICWDMLFPEIFDRLKRQSVDIIYCPSYWYKEIAATILEQNPSSEEQLLDALCLTRAVETNAALIYCNAAGSMENRDGSRDTLIGHSQAIMPGLCVIQRSATNEEEMLIADIDLQVLKKTAEIYKA